MFKPELLLPAGTVESFFAALEGGADAIYLGLQDFNARKRARNFSIFQLPTLISLAHKQKTKLYITLNTVIKNDELADLYILLAQLEQTNIDAIIIQDWGVFHLAKKFFPKLTIHASTQMAFHNAPGANFAARAGIERVILARELTLKELTDIKKNSKVELELFVHGALCYSFSGMCLFSSYLGGMSANRGACKQPCRRMFTDNNSKHYLFSLKDNELINFVPELARIGISSLKIEGRMKSAEYVYTIARAYRLVLDNHNKLNDAKELLQQDIGREKTSYFMGGNVSDAITDLPNTGLFTGKVSHIENGRFTFETETNASDIKRVRIVSPDGSYQETLKLKEKEIAENYVTANTNNLDFKKGFHVFIIGFEGQSFPNKLPNMNTKPLKAPHIKEATKKVQNLLKQSNIRRPILFFRIDSLAWLRKIHLDKIDQLLLNLPFKEWENLPLTSPFLAKNKAKLIAELPKFISEENCDKYRKLCLKLQNNGINKFMINHVSQLEIIPKNAIKYSSEYVYAFNDAAVAQLQRFNINAHVYPQETDFQNLYTGKDRSGIIALHFTPQLFYSRMPVKTKNTEGKFIDDTKISYQVVQKSGITYTLPQKPVSIFQNKTELINKGFKQFLIDVSFTSPSQNSFKTLIKRYYKAEQLQPSTSFNYKKGLS